MKTTDLAADRNIHALLYGPTGAGKTDLLGRFNVFGPVWINDSDGKIATLTGWPDITYEQWYDRPGQDNERGGPKGWKDLMKFIDGQILKPEYKTYGFDSLTTLAESAAAFVMHRTDPGKEVIGLQHYQPLYAQLTLLTVKIRQLNAHVILTAHEEDTRDERGRRRVQPLVIGQKFTPRLPVYWNNIWHLSVEPPESEGSKPKRYLRLQSDGEHIATSLSDQEVLVLTDPTVHSLAELFGITVPASAGATSGESR